MLTKLQLNLDAIRSNLEYFESRCGGPGRIMPVLKCNAYEMGVIHIASALSGTNISAACVATVNEGVTLRNAGCEIDLLVFAPIASYPDDAIEACVEHNLQPTLGSPAGLQRFEEACKHAPALRGQLNLDIGMNRYGWRATPQEMNLENVKGNLTGVYSHVAFHSDTSRIKEAISDFQAVSATFNIPRHVASTMVAANLPTDVLSQFEHTRIGLGLFGLLPNHCCTEVKSKLIPAIKFETKVTAVRAIEAGSGISYDHGFISQSKAEVATIPVGYNHGLAANASGKLEFEVNGQVAKQVGRITMDSCMLDVTGLPPVSIGDSVKLLDHEGKCSTADDWCEAMNCSSWELVVTLGKGNAPVCVEAKQGNAPSKINQKAIQT